MPLKRGGNMTDEHEKAEHAWHRIATRDRNHGLESIGRAVFRPLDYQQWLEMLAAVCKNNLLHDGRVPDLEWPFTGIVQDDTEVCSMFNIIPVNSGGKLMLKPIKGGFECIWLRT